MYSCIRAPCTSTFFLRCDLCGVDLPENSHIGSETVYRTVDVNCRNMEVGTLGTIVRVLQGKFSVKGWVYI